MWHKHWPEFMYVGQWPIFHGPVILAYILKTIWWTNVIIGILVPGDAKIYLIKRMWVIDLHIMVQWFYLISRRLFDGLMLYWRYWFSVTQTLAWNYVCRSVIYISWSSDFALYLEDHLMDKCHKRNIGSMWWKDVPHKMYMYVVQWPTFHGPVIQYDIKFDLHVTYISWNSDPALYIQFSLMNKPYSLVIGSVWYGPLTCISWFSNFKSFTNFLPIVVCWKVKR